MFEDRYFMADDCPNCGEKDELNQWKGARMGSTRWGHNYSCCSDKCGMEFKNSEKRKQMDRLFIQKQISNLQRQLKSI